MGREFNLGLISTEFLWLTPYLGIRTSNLRLEIKKDIEYTASEGTIGITGKNNADGRFGVLTGATLSLGNTWGVRLEGRFIDETAVSLSGTFRF